MNAVRIAWASPYATTYQVEYWVGKRALDWDEGPQGEWKMFSKVRSETRKAARRI